MTLQERLRFEANTLRTKSMPLKHLIPMLQQAADALDKAETERKPMTPQQILDLIPDDNTENDIGEWIVLVVRGVEAFHDIKETK